MKLSEHGIYINKQTGDLIINVTDFGLFSGTYRKIPEKTRYFNAEMNQI